MINQETIQVKKFSYNNVFIVDDRNNWEKCIHKYDKYNDLLLCCDFGLKKKLLDENCQVAFLDHLIDGSVMQHYNFEMHNFLNGWFKSEYGENLLTYEEFNIGDALLLNVYNEITYYCHFFFNLLALKHIKYKTLYVCVNERLIIDILNKLNIPFIEMVANSDAGYPVYLFPISKWMNEKVNRTELKSRLKDIAASAFDCFFEIVDSVFKQKKTTRLFIQGYYPTFEIINRLLKRKSIGLILGNYMGLKNIHKQRRIFFLNRKTKVNSEDILKRFTSTKKADWIVNGYELSAYIYEIITPIIQNDVPLAVARAQSIKLFFNKKPIKLMVPVTNLWLNNRLIMNYCKENNIPIFMIINGLLNTDFTHEAKDSDWVNCYSESIKKEYYKNSATAIPLGDPRMDAYSAIKPRHINYQYPNIVIGAAGFDPTDLNSYVAYEFDFLFDILQVINDLRTEGYKNQVVLKVRANGYIGLYKSFIDEYYPQLNVKIEQAIPFIEVVKQADLYISFYSQTVFEASCLGVPVIYFKKDNQYFHAPFNNNSNELTTAINTEELKSKISAFYSQDSCFDLFLTKQVMEKYIGNLDGKNTERNLEFIDSLIKNNY